MEMPKRGESYLVITITPDGGIYKNVYDAALRVNQVGKAVPVPPHGRLVDADALAEKIDGIWDCNDMVFRPNDKICKIPEDCKGCKWAQTKDFIKCMVENAPTVLEAEEQSGKAGELED